MPALIFFEVGLQNLAIKAEFITEIIRSVAITSLPQLPPPFIGVINYRSRVVPVVRLGNLPGFNSHGSSLTEHMIIVENGSPGGLCLVVDQVTAFKAVEELYPVADLDNPGCYSRLTPELVKLENGLVPVLEISVLIKSEAVVKLDQTNSFNNN